MGFSSPTLDQPAVSQRPRLEWEEPACLLCGGQTFDPLMEAPDPAAGDQGLWFLVVRCRDCGLCFTNPRPTVETIGQFYPNDYQPHLKTRGRLSLWRYFLDRCTGNYRKVLPIQGQGRLLDFGCGGGSYLHRMKEQGWTVTGLDCSQEAVQRIRNELGLPAYLGSLPHDELEPESFDVITMWQALEHVHWPLDVLRAARELLVPGGRIIIAVPNMDSLPFHWFGQAWHGLELPRHLTHFTPDTLSMMVKRAGFTPSRVRMIRHPSWLRFSANRVVKGSRWQRLLRRKLVANLASWWAYLQRRSDCMMITGTKLGGTP